MPIPPPNKPSKFEGMLLALYRRFDYDEVIGLRDSVGSYVSSKARSIQKQIDSLKTATEDPTWSPDEYRYHLEAEGEFLGEIQGLADELSIFAIHKKLEITIRKLVVKFYPVLDRHELHKIDYLKNNLPFSIETLAGFASVNELRLINNAIKHEGIVSKALAKYAGWTEGERLNNLGSAFHRLAPGVETYVAEFCDAVRNDTGA